MLAKALSSLVVAVVLCCPMLCGGAHLLRDHGDAAPIDKAPHGPHTPHDSDPCFCNGPALPTHGPAVDFTGPLAGWTSPGDGAQEPALCPGYLSVADRPPRLVASDRCLPLLI
jgi:hypothetical protein